MYSVVLMAALTAGTSTPSWCWGCSGCHGGWGGCHGCHGLFSGWHGCHGCYGCSGSGCHGIWYGCHTYAGYGCYCWGGCYGAYAAGCSGAGCYGCFGCHGMPAAAPSYMGAPGAPGGGAPEQVPAPKKEEKKTTSLNQARLIVELPADAKLYVDDRLMQTNSERRVFSSPRLEDGQTYYYILRAEVVRDGQTLSDTKRVLVRAGDVVEASFRDLEHLAAVGTNAATARAEARIGQ